MSAYIVLFRPGLRGPEAAETQRRLEDLGWRITLQEDGLVVALRGRWSLPVHKLPGRKGVLIGEAFDRRATDRGEAEPFTLATLQHLLPLQAGQRLSLASWGRYVACLRGDDQTLSVFRDPSGSLDCALWRIGATMVVSNAPPDEGLRPRGLAIDWVAVSAILRNASLSSQTCALHAVSFVAPGQLWRGDRNRIESVWTPAQIARSPQRRTPEALAHRVDAVVRALNLGGKRVLAEASGGLDSAIVASTLRRCGASISSLVNQSSPWAESDEREFARDLAQNIEASLVEVERPIFRLQPADLLRASAALRPNLGAQDAPYDEVMATLIDQVAAEAVFTGHGGDVVFFQMLAPAIASDLVREALPIRTRLARLVLWSMRSRQTIWRTIAQGLFEGGGPWAPKAAPFLAATSSPLATHPWLASAKSLSAAKRYQIFTLINTQLLMGDRLMRNAADVVHPLLMQPVVEFCLKMPASDLAVGTHDRPFARQAFADRLTPRSLLRHGKGDTAGLYARSVADSLDALAPFLLNGRLVDRGLIERETLRSYLDADSMMWRSAAGPILQAAYVEAWVRSWEVRLPERSAKP